MTAEFLKLTERVAQIEQRLKGLVRQAVVKEVDPAAGTVRLLLGTSDNGDYLSAKIPYVQTAGAMRFHNPPSVGQQMALYSPGGDMRQAFAAPLMFSDDIESPSAEPDEHVMTFGDVTIRVKTNAVEFEVSGVSLRIDGTGAYHVGGSVKHNGTTIDDTHTHGGVTAGGSRTDDPK